MSEELIRPSRFLLVPKRDEPPRRMRSINVSRSFGIHFPLLYTLFPFFLLLSLHLHRRLFFNLFHFLVLRISSCLFLRCCCRRRTGYERSCVRIQTWIRCQRCRFWTCFVVVFGVVESSSSFLLGFLVPVRRKEPEKPWVSLV